MWQTWTGGPAMAPVQSPQSQGTMGPAGAGGWHPTIIYLVVLLFFEAAIVGFLSRRVLR